MIFPIVPNDLPMLDDWQLAFVILQDDDLFPSNRFKEEIENNNFENVRDLTLKHGNYDGFLLVNIGQDISHPINMKQHSLDMALIRSIFQCTFQNYVKIQCYLIVLKYT